ncbi:basic proline-rich protein-like [Suncus etruscus]|uniref:basic proline-rich protein-like n=1 Tax=Suncus etruscus TaxID=109475 RepID=UPI00210F6FA7|nr:basic proline-rich protein-like [Suncus etruscus]
MVGASASLRASLARLRARWRPAHPTGFREARPPGPGSPDRSHPGAALYAGPRSRRAAQGSVAASKAPGHRGARPPPGPRAPGPLGCYFNLLLGCFQGNR